MRINVRLVKDIPTASKWRFERVHSGHFSEFVSWAMYDCKSVRHVFKRVLPESSCMPGDRFFIKYFDSNRYCWRCVGSVGVDVPSPDFEYSI